MKKHIITALLFILFVLPNTLIAQEEVIMGAGYVNDVYFELGSGVSEEVEREGWDIGFFTTPESAGIITNGSIGVDLRTYGNGDTTDWKDIDTTGLSTWTLLYNGDDSWENGAFNRLSTGGNDVGWGIRNTGTDDIIGDSLYILKLAGGDYIQLWIERKIYAENKYEIKWADLDGNNVNSETLDIDNFLGVNFAFFDFASEDLFDREPASDEWDILFTRQMVLQPNGDYFPVVSVFQNTNSPANRFHPVPLDFNEWWVLPLEYKKSVIGGDWKWFDLTGFQWNLVDSLIFFTAAINQNVYKIYFTEYEGTSTGYIQFEAEVVSMVDINEPFDDDLSFTISPNPARDLLSIRLAEAYAKETEVRVYDMGGRQVLYSRHDGYENEIKMDISSLEEGMYVVSVFEDGKVATEKLIVK